MAGDGEDQAIYTFEIPISGYYEVYAWWASDPVCSQNTPYIISFSDGTVTVRVNQQLNPGQWNFLATGFFEEGEQQVIISDDASNTVVVADAIRIAPEQSVNYAPILDPIGNMSVNEGELIEFTITASDPDGDVLTYSATNLPEGAAFDPEAQLFSWTPGWQSSGRHNDIVFSVSDGSDYDEEIIAIDVIDKSPLVAPTGLVAVYDGNSIALAWNSVIQTELYGYNVFRSTSNPGYYEKLNDFPITSTQYTDNNFEPGITYYYFVTAVDVFNQTEVFATGLIFPMDITFNDEGQLFTGSWTEGIIWRIDYDGNWSIYASEIGNIGTLTFHNGYLYLTDWSDGFISRIDPNGVVSTYTEGFDIPSGIAFNENGEGFISEDLDGRIYKTTNDGITWDLFIEGLDGPGKMIFNNSGNLYVAEDIWIGDDFLGAIDIIYPDGTMEVLANLTDPDGLCFDQSGNLYVGQSEVGQVTRLMLDGNSMPVIQDITPWGCGINKFGELIVSLPWDGQIIKVHLSHESDISNIVSTTLTSNDAPVVSDISDQTIAEGESFASITLDGYVEDVEDPDAAITWSTAGHTELIVTIDEDRVATVTTPDESWSGSETITFRATDTAGAWAQDDVTFTVTVTPENAPPVALDDAYSVNEGDSLVINAPGVLGNDSDLDGDTLTAALVEGPTYGTLTLDADGSFTYDPGDDFTGTDSFTYKANDGTADSNEATVFITVMASNNTPILDPIGNMSADEDQLLTFTVTATDPDGDSLTFSASNLPDGATFDPETQTFSWLPQHGQAGTYTNVLFMVSDDGDPLLSDSEQIEITVQSSSAPVNIIIDNTDPGFQLPGSGAWETVYNPPWPCYGNDIRYNMAGDGEDQAIYTFDIPRSGYYEVYAWWASDPVCSQDTPYTISFSDGTVTIRANQQLNPGQWNLLATGFFEEGEQQIIISDDASGTIVTADAVRIVSVQ
jgi:VCBS repeat-containing protein